MSATNYSACLAETLKWEGGYSDNKADPGGPTKYGITIYDVRKYIKPNATAADVKALTIDQAKTIYRERYWNVVSGDTWPDGLDLCVFDAAVNSGVGRADDWARYAMSTTLAGYGALANYARALPDKVPAIKRYCTKRLSFLRALRTWATFGGGWGRRVAGIEALAVRMALAVAGHSPEVVNDKLHKEADQAKAKSKSSGAGAGTTTVGGGAGASHIDWSQHPILIGIGIFVAIIVVAYFIYWTIQHRNRARAYQAVAEGR